MKIIIYFSRSGHNRKVATELSQKIGAPLKEIIDLKPRGYFMSGWGGMRRKTSPIKEIDFSISENDEVILVCPIWVSIPPAVRTFIETYKEKLKKISLVSVSGAGTKNEPQFDALEKQYGLIIAPRLLISDEEFSDNSYQDDLENFSKKI